MTKHRSILISTKKYWVKTLVNHQSNWAVVDDLPDELGVRVWFFDIEGWISDYLDFLSHEDAEVALLRNSFKKHSEREFGSLDYPAGNFLWWMPEKPSERPYSTGHHWTD